MKRIYIRKGDIFCINIDNKEKVFFQFLTTDITQLNSCVIRVFKKKYCISYTPTINEILKDEIDFYVHTIIKLGIKNNVWEKVGHSMDLGQTDNIMFKMDASENRIVQKSYNWLIWRINTPMIRIGEMKEEYRHFHYGPILPYTFIINKIKTGDFGFPIPE